MAGTYITQVSEEIEGKVIRKTSPEFERTDSGFLGALSKLDEFLLNPQVQICSIVVPGTSRKNNSEKREPTEDRSLDNAFPHATFSACQTSHLNGSEQEETFYSSDLEKLEGFFSKKNNLFCQKNKSIVSRILTIPVTFYGKFFTT